MIFSHSVFPKFSSLKKQKQKKKKKYFLKCVHRTCEKNENSLEKFSHSKILQNCKKKSAFSLSANFHRKSLTNFCDRVKEIA